jgi:hypothetical protein
MLPDEFTEEEIENYRRSRIGRQTFETGLSRDERYILNKIHHDYILKLEKTIEDCKKELDNDI